jgi:hypothetical protein
VDEHERADGEPWDRGETGFGWELRVLAVSAFWALPGGVAAVFARLWVPEGGSVLWWTVGGALAGAVAGGLLEADYWP